MAQRLRALALEYPETYEESPWGDRVVKVRGKIFFSCAVHEGKLHATAKLPTSGRKMLERAEAEPTHYGMGKYGWVTFTFADGKKVREDEVRAWIAESFAAVAPKALLKEMAAGGGAASAKPATAKSQSAKPATAKVKAQSETAEAGAASAKAGAASAKAGAATAKAGAATAKAGAATARGKPKARAVLVCGDPIRAKRAVEALAERAIAAEVIASAAEVKLSRVRALIVDVGRHPREGLKLAAEVDASDRPIHLFVTGVRDAEQEHKLQKLGSAESFRAPPGDEAVVAAIAGVLLAR